MIFCIFTMRPDGSSWQYRGDIDAPNSAAAKYVAETMLKSIDGVRRSVEVRGPGESLPVKDGPTTSDRVLPVLSTKIPKPMVPPKVKTAPKPAAATTSIAPSRRPLGRFRNEDARRALEQDDKTRELLSDVFSQPSVL